MDLTKKYKDCKVTYTVSLLRIIEENYDFLYQEMIWWSRQRGAMVSARDPLVLMEYKTDFDRALAYVKRVGLYRKRWRSMSGEYKMTYKTVEAMKEILNGEDS